MSTYLSVADTARHVRAALKAAFPGVKFSVRSKSYAGGASIDVSWTDGPTEAAVTPITHQYAGGRFDGMIDMAFYVSHWLLPDGTTVVEHNPGSTGHVRVSYQAQNGTLRELVEGAPVMRVATAPACRNCGNWMDGDCWVARYTEHRPGYDADRVGFACTQACAGKIIARHTDALVPA